MSAPTRALENREVARKDVSDPEQDEAAEGSDEEAVEKACQSLALETHEQLDRHQECGQEEKQRNTVDHDVDRVESLDDQLERLLCQQRERGLRYGKTGKRDEMCGPKSRGRSGKGLHCLGRAK